MRERMKREASNEGKQECYRGDETRERGRDSICYPLSSFSLASSIFSSLQLCCPSLYLTLILSLSANFKLRDKRNSVQYSSIQTRAEGEENRCKNSEREDEKEREREMTERERICNTRIVSRMREGMREKNSLWCKRRCPDGEREKILSLSMREK